MKNIKIDSLLIGDNSPCKIIAEIGNAHDGSLGIAHSYIDAATEIGLDAIKFQTHIANAESTFDEQFRVNFSYEDSTRYDYWKRMEFTKEQWKGLAEHAANNNILFLSSAFSIEAVDLLANIGMPAWKVGSGEIASLDLIEAMCDAGGPILLSTGLCNIKELDSIIEIIKKKGNDFCIFQCTSKYPSSYKDIGLNVINELKNRYNCPVGLSDHSGKVFPSIFAISNESNLIETHMVFDKNSFGPDSKASLTPEELKLIVEARDAYYIMKKNPIDKNVISEDIINMKRLFGKSIATNINLTKGTILDKNVLVMKKPSTGIKIDDLDLLVGRRLKRDVSMGRLLSWDDIENE